MARKSKFRFTVNTDLDQDVEFPSLTKALAFARREAKEVPIGSSVKVFQDARLIWERKRAEKHVITVFLDDSIRLQGKGIKNEPMETEKSNHMADNLEQ